MQKTRLGIIFGGRSGEHAVSLMSARSVLSVLDPQRYEVTAIAITQQGAWVTIPGAGAWDVLQTLEALASDPNARREDLRHVTLLADAGQNSVFVVDETTQMQPLAEIDVFFPLLHGTFGEDGTVQGLLELADAAYVGAGVLGSAVGMDKALFKDVMRANNLPVVDSLIVTRGDLQHGIDAIIQQAEARWGYPLFTKPANLGSSVGITKCRSRSDLYEGLLEAAQYDRRVLVEQGIARARELEVSVLGNDDAQVSIAGEIRPSADFYTYDAKYIDERSEIVIPAPISAETMQRVQAIALAAYRAIDCAGMARADFLLDPRDESVYISEINTIPGFTKISMYPKLWEASGLPYPALIDRLIELAAARKGERDQTVRQFRRNV